MSVIPTTGGWDESDDSSILLSDLTNGDKTLEAKVIAYSQNPYGPLILPRWNLGPCEEFYKKAVSYGEEGGVILPPAPIFNGAHPVGAATTSAVLQMQVDIWSYLAVINPGAMEIGNVERGFVFLACSTFQFGVACSQLSCLDHQPWFQSVLAHGTSLSAPLARLYLPLEDLPGLWGSLSLPCKLWTSFT